MIEQSASKRSMRKRAAGACLDLIVMDAYGHPYLQGRILDGVTRGMPQFMTAPAMMSP